MKKASLSLLLVLFIVCLVSVNSWLFQNLAKNATDQAFTEEQAVSTQQQYWLEQIIDHYDYLDSKTWQQRFYVIKDHFKPETGAVLMYICGESICNGVREGGWVTKIAE